MLCKVAEPCSALGPVAIFAYQRVNIVYYPCSAAVMAVVNSSNSCYYGRYIQMGAANTTITSVNYLNIRWLFVVIVVYFQ